MRGQEFDKQAVFSDHPGTDYSLTAVRARTVWTSRLEVRDMSDDTEERDAFGAALRQRQRDGQGGQARGFMDRQRDQLHEQVGGAMKQIEQLRLRQEQLSHDKSELESLLRRQSEYLAAKQSLMVQLRHGATVLERREGESVRLLELIRESRLRFAQTLDLLGRIDEEGWADKSFDTELTNAAALVAEGQAMRDRLMAQIEALAWRGTGEDARGSSMGMRSGDFELFRTWFLRGIAFSVPVIALALLAYLLIRLAS
jgi:hypothetical protein